MGSSLEQPRVNEMRSRIDPIRRIAARLAQREQYDYTDEPGSVQPIPYLDHDVGEAAWMQQWDAELKRLIRYDDAAGQGRLRAAIEAADWELAERLAQDYKANRIYQWMQMGRQAQLEQADPARQAQILWKICNVLRSSPIWQQLEPAAQLLDQQAQQLAAQAGSEFSRLVDQATIDAEPTPDDLMWFGSRTATAGGPRYKVYMWGDRSNSWVDVTVEAESPEQAAQLALGASEGQEADISPMSSDIAGVSMFQDNSFGTPIMVMSAP